MALTGGWIRHHSFMYSTNVILLSQYSDYNSKLYWASTILTDFLMSLNKMACEFLKIPVRSENDFDWYLKICPI